MYLGKQIAKNIRDFYSGGNWTAVNLKDQLNGLTWEQALQQVHDFNTIATLVFHIGYYVTAVTKALKTGVLDAHDKFAFTHPPIQSQADWDQFVTTTFAEAEALATQVEALTDEQIMGDFIDAKYGNYFRNLMGIVQHGHYHLGQITLIKKILAEQALP